jgi:hypothetical protein
MGLESGNRALIPKEATERRLAKARKLNPLRKRWFFSFDANLR